MVKEVICEVKEDYFTAQNKLLQAQSERREGMQIQQSKQVYCWA